MKKQLHIGQKIKDRLDDRGMVPAEFARRLDRTSQSVYHIFKSPSIDTELLQRIGEILDYDFFSYYSTGKERVSEQKATRNKISILIDIEDPDQAKAILKLAGITRK